MKPAEVLFTSPCKFLLSAPQPEGLPNPHFPEIAFIGRSNVGKSSLINALTGRPGLARASVTPGRTQTFNCFLLADRLMLVDLPGYGFAKAPKKMVEQWNRHMRRYLWNRPNLRRVCVLIDARRGLMDSDHEMLSLLDEAAVSYQLVLTKADKLSASESDQVLAAVQGEASNHPAAWQEVLLTSAEKRQGIDALRATLTEALKA